MQGDGALTNLKNLYYLSCNTLDNPDVVKYGKARLHRELVDLWVDGKIAYGGMEFKSDDPVLTQSAASLNFVSFRLLPLALKLKFLPVSWGPAAIWVFGYWIHLFC